MNKGKENFVLKLTKALYGLKQAPRVWNAKLNRIMLDLGFSKSKLDTTLYHKGSEKTKLLGGFYVDDLVIMGASKVHIKKFKEAMMRAFEMVDLGLLNSYLGIEIKQSTWSIYLS